MIEILFVEDQPQQLTDLEQSLRKFRNEWSMEFVADGKEAQRRLAKRTFDVVVAALDMKDVSGGELLAQVRDQAPQTIRILLSKRGDYERAVQSTSCAHQHLPKPCDPDLLEMTIADAFSLRYHLESNAIRDLVGRLGQLPILPSVYTELMRELDSPHSSVARVGEIISGDVSISAKILQLVNSSYFGLPVHVTDVSHAVALLGLNVIKPLVLTSGLFEQFAPGSLGQFSLNSLVDHSTEVALAARCIAQLEGAVAEDCDHAFMAGMLHDLGQLVLAKNFAAQYDTMREHARETDIPLHELEVAEFQANHADLAAYLLGLWGLPAPIVEAIVWHHTPANSTHDRFTPLAALHVAECLLTQQDNAIGESSPVSAEFLSRIGRQQRLETWSTALGVETATA